MHVPTGFLYCSCQQSSQTCPLTLISPHQYLYSNYFRHDHLCSTEQSLRYSFSTEFREYLHDKDFYLSLGLWCFGSFMWLLQLVHKHTHTNTHTKPSQKFSISASSTRIVIIIIVGKSLSCPTISSFFWRELGCCYSSSPGEVKSVCVIILATRMVN